MTLILNEQQIQQKIKRLAIQILENHFGESNLIFIGVNDNGLRFARLLLQAFQEIDQPKPTVELTQIRLNPAHPLQTPVTVGLPLENLENKNILVIDDVANTGRTLFYAMQPFMVSVVPRSIEAVVLVDRKHKSFPIQVDYFGVTLATTLSEHIEVSIAEQGQQTVYLK